MMDVVRRLCMPCVTGVIFVILISNKMVYAIESNDFGSLKLCPVGGPSFVYAWNIACEMKRKKRSLPGLTDVILSNPISSSKPKRSLDGYRPATFGEIMKICCEVGCEIRDLLAYCDPFGEWNS